MQADGRRLQQNLRLRQQPRLESLRLHAQSQAKRRKKIFFYSHNNLLLVLTK